MIWLLLACSDYSVRTGPEVPVAEPPGRGDDEFGDAPSWSDCTQGWQGDYANLDPDDPYVVDALTAPNDPIELDWWDDPVFSTFDPVLEFGSGWWPVDEGLADDPGVFAVRWRAWMRVWEPGAVPFVVGAQDDVWVVVGDDVALSMPGPQPYEPDQVELDLSDVPSQVPITVYFAHRVSPDSGLRFRPLDPDAVTICLAE